MSSGIFPRRLKYAEIVPLLKKGDKKELSNYRPVSFLTAFSKVFEEIIYVRLCQLLINRSVFLNEQFGLKAKSSTAKAIFNLINEILEALISKKVVGGIFYNLEKAFDSVNHDILLCKLNFYGIRGPFYKLIKSYLTNRYQRVLIGAKAYYHSSYLEWGKINHGIPQGSILGPFRFLFYINDLLKIVEYNSKPTLFAYDTSFSLIPITQTLKPILIMFFQLNKWLDDNLLFLNYERTQYVHFTLKGTGLHEAPIGYNNNFISNSTSTKFLAVIIENTLSWKAHIDHLLPKLSACYGVRTIKPFMCQENLKSVYYSCFHSLMTHGIIFWGNSTHSIYVFRLQKRVTRIITDSRPTDSCRQLFKKLGILPLMLQYIFPLLLCIVSNEALFQMNFEIHSINTKV